MTPRRSVLGALAAAPLALPRALAAQAPAKLHRIGWLSGSAYRGTPLWDAFVEGMRERGWVEDRDYAVDSLLSEGRNERLPGLAAELVRREVDLIVTAGTPPTAAAKAATTTIPVVFFYVGDPVGSGFVASLAHPGGNVTGLGGLGVGLHAKQLELLKQVVPRAAHVAAMHNPQLPLHARYMEEIGAAAVKLGVVLRPIELRSPADIDGIFARLARDPVDAVHVLGQPFHFAHGERFAGLAIAQRLPAIVAFEELARVGLLLAYGSRLIDDVRRLPHFVDRILKGAPPAELPVEQPTRFHLVVNLKTARSIGVVVPQSVLLRADEVIQ